MAKTSTKKTSTIGIIDECKCLMCGETFPKTTKYFYSVRNAWQWKKEDNVAPYCKECIIKRFKLMEKQYDEKSALIDACSYLGLPYIHSFYLGYEQKKKEFNIGEYIRTCGLPSQIHKDFMYSLLNGEMTMRLTDSEDTRWSNKDKRSKNKVLNLLRRDPFIEFDEDIRKELFNKMDDYLADDDIAENVHKLNSVVAMMMAEGQIAHIDKDLNTIMRENIVGQVDYTRMKDLVDIKKKLQDSASKIASDNGISTKTTQKGTRGTASLAYQVRQLSEMDFTAAQVNKFDIETSEAMQQVADMSMRAIFNTMALNDNDYLEMLKNQTEDITKLQKSLDEKEEEIRKLKLEVNGVKLKKVVV